MIGCMLLSIIGCTLLSIIRLQCVWHMIRPASVIVNDARCIAKGKEKRFYVKTGKRIMWRWTEGESTMREREYIYIYTKLRNGQLRSTGFRWNWIGKKRVGSVDLASITVNSETSKLLSNNLSTIVDLHARLIQNQKNIAKKNIVLINLFKKLWAL